MKGPSHRFTAWLCELGVEQYAQVSRDNGIDVRVLPKLTADDPNHLGITKGGHRWLLLEAIAAFRELTPTAAEARVEAVGRGSQARPISAIALPR